MSENILKALMQLFAIVARPNDNDSVRRALVHEFLSQQLNNELVKEYLIVFDNFFQKQKKRKTHTSRKGLSAGSVKLLSICTLINKELTLKQKLIVVIRLLEFIKTDNNTTEQEFEFVETVAEIFYIPQKDYSELKELIYNKVEQLPDTSKLLVINNVKECSRLRIKHLYTETLLAPIVVYHNVKANMHVFIYHGNKEMYLNGLLIHKDRVYMLSSGSSIRNAKRFPIYYSDIVSAFNDNELQEKIVFEAKNLSYKFKSGVFGLQKTNFVEKSGKLVGIMGASGSGKSTLLGALNGSLKPTTGQVLINGFDVNKDKEEIEGIIGHVSQDDLLIEDLTVFENLYYNAKLCFDDLNKNQILRKVTVILKSIGLYHIKDMKVGSPLNKKVSGGQRKRLNIALELIREPSVLFLDEPTSGLSSRDSEQILDLLKELTLKGKLIFVVIHQPSSDIFKMFDRLIILDQGGYFIYDGDPVDSIVYFKSKIKQADWSASECPTCGNVTPEQIFNIVESEMLDEYGNITSTRKTLPHEWYMFYNKESENEKEKIKYPKKLPKITFKIPNRIKQILVFSQRELKAKLGNTQYALINLLEAPILALMLSFIIKYYNIENPDAAYAFIYNSNIPVYIFMSIIVSLFMGMTISANEIIKDRKILKRESFLNLSKMSYLSSKLSILLGIAAYQSLIYVLVGNTVLEVKGMYFEYWLMLFTTWAFAVILGLNISDGFKTTVTIYIVIPFLLIPQIILSGIIVKYDELNPKISNPDKIPWFGEIITARWAYEGLAVYQFTNNKYSKNTFKYERIKKQMSFKKDAWLSNLKTKIKFIEDNILDKKQIKKLNKTLEIIRNEFLKEINRNSEIKTELNIENLYIDKISKNDFNILKKYTKDLYKHFVRVYNFYDNEQQKYINSKSEKELSELRKNYYNERLEIFVTNKTRINPILEYGGQLFQKTNLIYKYPETTLFSHFYAPKKLLFGKYYNTFFVNIIVIWTFSIFLFITLYFSALRRSFEFVNTLKEKRLAKKMLKLDSKK